MSDQRTGTPRDAARVLAAVALSCTLAQTISATLAWRDLETPNASTRLARNLVEGKGYGVPDWTVLRGPAAIGNGDFLRAYQLPGEPLYLAAGFLLLPESARRYLHVPVTVLLVVAIAALAFVIGGRRLALVTGLLASADPFVILHGPVWDDMFLAAALQWTVFAVLVNVVARAKGSADAEARRSQKASWVLVGVCAGLAAITRTEAQIMLGLVALAAIGLPALKPLRAHGWAIVVGLVLFVGAWGIRNAVVLGEFFVGTSRDGLTLFRTNYATARPSILETGAAEWFAPERLAAEYAAVASLGELDADRYFRKRAWAYLRSHPVDVAKTASLKWFVSLTGLNPAAPLRSPRNVVSIGANLSFMLLAFWSVPGWRRRFARTPEGLVVTVLCAVTTAVTLVMLALGPVGLRYRIGFAGFMYVAAAALLVRSRPFLPWARHDS